jgi:3-deoxy-D-manno-octulosonic-acid transferase
MVRVLYQLLYSLLLVLASPFLVLKMLRRGQWKQGFGQRFGHYDADLIEKIAGRKTLWLNAVSVGEVNLTVQLVSLLRKRLPDTILVVSTTTTTGMAELKRKLPDEVLKIYYPLDQRSFVRRALATIRPDAIVLIEADFWPNLLWEAEAEGIPVLLVNALISERSARLYRKFGILFRQLFVSFDRVFCADSVDRDRLVALGCRPDAISVVGHPKFDTALAAEGEPLDVRALLDRAGLDRDKIVLLGGSTHASEEAMLARIYLRLKSDHPQLFLVLVPRHFERANEVAHELSNMGIEVILRTNLPESRPDLAVTPHCLIVNTTGELRHFYGEADIVFIGQSFVEGGGQNPIEPAVHGRAILTGPMMETFKAILPHFLENEALIQVRDDRELESSITELLDNPENRAALGQRARKVVEANQGAMERTAAGILLTLEQTELRKSPPVI